MKTVIKLVLIYFLFQFASVFALFIPCTLLSLALYGNADQAQNWVLGPALLIAMLCMGGYLWKKGYIPAMRTTWSPVSATYLILAIILSLSCILLVDGLMSQLPWIPDWSDESFKKILTTWTGVLGVTILGPVLEELLFRGAITTVLLKKYSPTKSILISALIFGLIHFNPAQSVGAFFLGILLAWMYYKTGSLIPVILVHIMNNCLAFYLSTNFPDVEYLKDIVGTNMYIILLMAALVLGCVSYLLIRPVTLVRNWKEADTEVELTNE